MESLRKRCGRVALMGALLGMLPTGALLGMLPMGAAAQQTGRIVGRVLDAGTGKPLSSVQVYVSDGSVGALTSLDGRYVLRDVPVGSHDVTAQNIGYGTKTVTGVTVAASRATELDVTMESRAVELEAIVVTSEAQRAQALGGGLRRDRRRADLPLARR